MNFEKRVGLNPEQLKQEQRRGLKLGVTLLAMSLAFIAGNKTAHYEAPQTDGGAEEVLTGADYRMPAVQPPLAHDRNPATHAPTSTPSVGNSLEFPTSLPAPISLSEPKPLMDSLAGHQD